MADIKRRLDEVEKNSKTISVDTEESSIDIVQDIKVEVEKITEDIHLPSYAVIPEAYKEEPSQIKHAWVTPFFTRKETEDNVKIKQVK